MAALDDIKLPANITLPAGFVGDVKDFLRKELWSWIDQHQDDAVTTLHIWIIRRTVRVRDLDPVFLLLLGPRPA